MNKFATISEDFNKLDSERTGKLKLFVYDEDEGQPYFHIIGFGEDSNKDVCVRIDVPEYRFNDENHSKFTDDEKEIFIKFITGNGDLNVQRWKAARALWNGYQQTSYTKWKVMPTECPDYTLLK